MPEATDGPVAENPRPEHRGATTPNTATRRVRVDEGSAAGRDLAPGRGSLLRAFGGWAGRPKSGPEPAAADRRAEPRHDRVECQAWVGWKSLRRFHMNNALVINLSRRGARIFLDTLPPPSHDASLWVYLQTPGQNAVVEARVRETSSTAGGQCLVCVEFVAPCPFAFFEAAVSSLATTDPKTRAARPARVTTAEGPRVR